MKGQLSKEIEVPVPASDLWDVYGTLELVRLIHKLLPEFLHDFEVDDDVGNGGVGTMLKIVLPPGSPIAYYKEKFIKVDEEKRIKVVDVVEGGYLEVGFSLYRTTFEIIEKDEHSSSVVTTIDYELDDASADNAAFVSIKPLEIVVESVGMYLHEKKNENHPANR
ncbi:hypothetical protein MKW94_007734 [Papaver nudicaule]|uniref:Bet v I/Major latex protein domain-containing protein n=1 Tax=Papaver nudicaule TaxID=74823 RepID=A0AA41VI34_PAPNU|nr:hypothetical protein [Papaver nudicaule]